MYKFKMARFMRPSDYIPEVGEVVMYDALDGLGFLTRIGDGKTAVHNLPPLASHDIYEKVFKLKKEVEMLKSELSAKVSE
jgi:hypothetical protein